MLKFRGDYEVKMYLTVKEEKIKGEFFIKRLIGILISVQVALTGVIFYALFEISKAIRILEISNVVSEEYQIEVSGIPNFIYYTLTIILIIGLYMALAKDKNSQ